MLIGCTNPALSRIYHVEGKAWKFTRVTPEDESLCNVDDAAAAAEFLHPRNANLFYAVGTAPKIEAPVLVTPPAAPEAAPEAPPAAPPSAPESTRETKIKDAIEVLLNRRGDDAGEGDFTGEGVPNCNVVSGLCGFTVRKAEMIAVWDTLNPADYGIDTAE